MRVKLLITIAFCAIGIVAKAQSVDQIKNSPDYYWGEATGKDRNEAYNKAMYQIANRIYVLLHSSSNRTTKNTVIAESDGKEIKTSKQKKTIQQSSIEFSTDIILRDVSIIEGEEGDDYKIFCYVSKSVIAYQLEQRKSKIIEWVKDAEKAEQEYRVADALRFYYWAYSLLSAHPDKDSIGYKDSASLGPYIIENINSIFLNVQASITGVEKGEFSQLVNLFITYKDHPVQNYDYTYTDGGYISNTVSARDGKGIVEVNLQNDLSDICLISEYVFKREANVDEELSDILAHTQIIPFSNNRVYVKPQTTNIESQIIQTDNISKTNTSIAFTILEEDLYYRNIIEEVESSIKNRNTYSIKDHFTDEGFSMFNRLIQYGNAKILSHQGYTFYKSLDGVLCRSLPMAFSFPNNKSFIEAIVFEFNNENKISSLSFQLEHEAIEDITSYERWGVYARQVLIRFLENYKTAYALERKDYIRSIFSDEALIIVGSVLKKPKQSDTPSLSIDEEYVKYTRYSKEEYLNNLEKVFAKNQFINLRFTENRIRKANGCDIYGIQIKQEYFSSTYGDTGYLFLAVDLKEPKEPIIYVRAWQPQKDPVKGIIGIEDFSINAQLYN